MWRYSGQFEIGAVDHGSFAATFLWTYQVLETLPTQTAAIILLTCRADREGRRKKEQNKKKGTENTDKQRGMTERRAERRSKRKDNQQNGNVRRWRQREKEETVRCQHLTYHNRWRRTTHHADASCISLTYCGFWHFPIKILSLYCLQVHGWWSQLVAVNENKTN